MKLFKICILSFLSLVLSACGGGGSGSDGSKGNEGLLYTTSLQLSDNLASLGQYRVCVDFNENIKCDDGELVSSLSGNTHTFKSSNAKLQKAILLAELNNTGAYFSAKAQGDNKTSKIDLKSSIQVVLIHSGMTEDNSQTLVNEYLKKLNLNENTNPIFNRNVIKVFKEIKDYKKIYSLFQVSLFKDILNPDFDINKLKGQNKTKKIVLNDTGLKKYFDGTSFVDSEVPSFPKQDASYGLDKTDNGFKFVKLDSKGNVLDANSNDFSCVKDERTGFIWEIKSSDISSPRYKFSTFAIDGTEGIQTAKSSALKATSCNKKDGLDSCKVSSYITYLNSQNYCGKNNWNLPTYLDSYNILDFSNEKTITVPSHYGEQSALQSSGYTVKNTTLYYGLDTNYFNDLYEKKEDFLYEERKNVKIINYDHMYFWTSSFNLQEKGNFLINPLSKIPYVSASDTGEEVFHLRLVSKD